MVSKKHQVLLNALANELEEKEIDVTHLARHGMQEPFDVQYQNLPKPPTIYGKTPDLQGEDGRGRIHLGEADISVSDPHTKAQLRIFVRYVIRNPSVSLHVAVPFEYRHNAKNMIQRIVRERRTFGKIRILPFHVVGNTCIPSPILRVW